MAKFKVGDIIKYVEPKPQYKKFKHIYKIIGVRGTGYDIKFIDTTYPNYISIIGSSFRNIIFNQIDENYVLYYNIDYNSIWDKIIRGN